MAEDGRKGINTAEAMDESPLSSVPEESHHEEDAMEQDHDTTERSDDAHAELSESSEGNESAGESDSADKDDLAAGQLCGRCWDKPASRTLYSCPTCDDCVAVAKSERVSIVFLFLFHLSPSISKNSSFNADIKQRKRPIKPGR